MKALDKLWETLLSRKFWVAVAALITYLSDKDPEQSWPVAIVAAAYIFGQALVDTAKAKNGGA